jgi:antitoxin (DNA-binding transcriptional repressor) of toxin-antitoxin stability system
LELTYFKQSVTVKTITLRQLHEKTGYLVRMAAHFGEIRVTDDGRIVAKILPECEQAEVPYFARRKVLPEFRALQNGGKLTGRTDSTLAISEDRG